VTSDMTRHSLNSVTPPVFFWLDLIEHCPSIYYSSSC
jgi:hypothetical protein